MLESPERRGSTLPGHQQHKQLGLSAQQSSRNSILCVTLAFPVDKCWRLCKPHSHDLRLLWDLQCKCHYQPSRAACSPTVQPHSWPHPQRECEAATPSAALWL